MKGGERGAEGCTEGGRICGGEGRVLGSQKAWDERMRRLRPIKGALRGGNQHSEPEERTPKRGTREKAPRPGGGDGRFGDFSPRLAGAQRRGIVREKTGREREKGKKGGKGGGRGARDSVHGQKRTERRAYAIARESVCFQSSEKERRRTSRTENASVATGNVGRGRESRLEAAARTTGGGSRGGPRPEAQGKIGAAPQRDVGCGAEETSSGDRNR